MRQNDWIERKAVNCIEEIFLKNNLQYQLDTNDKTEFIDGHVCVRNEIGQSLGIDIGKIELQVKGRTNSKKVTFKKSFIEYCKSNVVPVVVVLVNIDSDKMVEGIYYKYIDGRLYEHLEKESYTVSFDKGDRVVSENIIKELNDIQNKHWNEIIRNISKVNNQILNKEMYLFVNSIIRSVNGFVYTTLKRYMDDYSKDLARFAIVYCSNGVKGISYSIIPIFKNNICNDIIEVNDTKSMYALGITRITSTGVDFTGNYINKFIMKILKEEIIPSIINEKIFCKFNKEMASRSLTYHFNNLLTLEKEKLSFEVKGSYLAEYSDTLKEIILSRSEQYKKSIVNSIVDLNIKLINNNLKKDIKFFKLHHNLNEYYSFYSECNDNKYIVDVVNGTYVIRVIKESKYFQLRDLIDIIDNEYILDLSDYYRINGFFKSLDEADDYLNLKYNFICDFCNNYVSMQAYEYRWNTFLNKVFKERALVTNEIYYHYKWSHIKDDNVKQNNHDIDLNKGLKSVQRRVIGDSINLKINQEPLVMEIYEDIIDIIFDEIDNNFNAVDN